MNNRPLDFKRLFDLLELDPKTMPDIRKVYKSREEVEKLCEEYHRKLKIAYRKVAKKYHPDKPEGDENRFKAITDIYEQAKRKIKVMPIQPRPQLRRGVTIIVGGYPFSSSTSTTSSTTTGGSFYWR